MSLTALIAVTIKKQQQNDQTYRVYPNLVLMERFFKQRLCNKTFLGWVTRRRKKNRIRPAIAEEEIEKRLKKQGKYRKRGIGVSVIGIYNVKVDFGRCQPQP